MKFHHLLWLSLFAAGGSVTLDAQRPAVLAGLDGFDRLRHTTLARSHDEDDDSDRQDRGKRRSVRDRDEDDRDSDRDSDSDGRNRRRRPGWGGFPDREANRDARRAPRDRGRNNVESIASDNGYADGYDKGLDDARSRRASDPTRHQWYRSADRGYDSRYGSRAQYTRIYRESFRDGYDAAYMDGNRNTRGRNGRWPLPWPLPFGM